MNAKTIKVIKRFDPSCGEWRDDSEYNMLFVKNMLNYCYDGILKERGYLFLNDVYHCLGLTLTRQGQVAGVVHGDPNNSELKIYIRHTDDDTNDLYIEFELLDNILEVLPEQ